MIPLKSFSQSTGELTTDSLVKMGFENVRWTDTPEERVYVVENSAYKIQALGIRKAVDIIQSMGLPKDKSCKLIVTNYNIPQVSLTYQPLAGDTTVVSGEDWKVSYDIGDSWDKVKKEKKKNSSLFKVDIICLLYTSDAADEEDSVDLGGCGIKKKKNQQTGRTRAKNPYNDRQSERRKSKQQRTKHSKKR